MTDTKTNKTTLSLVILGATNAGKSTLMNKIFGSNIVHIADQTNSTKKNVLATKVHKNCQIVFYDTPGLGTKHTLKKLYQTSQPVLQKADYVLILCDGSRKTFPKYLLDYVPPHKPLFIVMNKIDMGKKHLLELTDQAYRLFQDNNPILFVDYISALKGDNINLLLDQIADHGKQTKEWPFPPQYTDQHTESLAIEALRGSLFKHYNQEIPHVVKINIYIVDKSIHYIIGAKLSQNNIILSKMNKLKKTCKYLLKLFLQDYCLASIKTISY